MSGLFPVTAVGETALARAKEILGDKWLLAEANKVKRRTPTIAQTHAEQHRAGYEDCARRAITYAAEQGFPRLAVDLQKHLGVTL